MKEDSDVDIVEGLLWGSPGHCHSDVSAIPLALFMGKRKITIARNESKKKEQKPLATYTPKELEDFPFLAAFGTAESLVVPSGRPRRTRSEKASSSKGKDNKDEADKDVEEDDAEEEEG